MIVNNCGEIQMQEISSYIDDFITKFKDVGEISSAELIGTSIKNNLGLAGALWLAGTTVVGLPIVLFIILYRGLCLGFTVATFAYTLGKFSGIMFCIVAMLLQNIFLIPALLTLGVSSIKLYKSIVKDRHKQNIKLEIIRHTIISGLMVGLLILSSLVESTISIPILKNFIKYF